MEPTLPAFNKDELAKVYCFLATRVAGMMGRKFEEGDWADAYCYAKQIPKRGWSNLAIDVMHRGLGVEHKMLCTKKQRSIKESCGTILMHPAGTRSIRIPDIKDATKAARDILRQYGELIEQRTKKVKEDAPGCKPDMRVGWLLWEVSLSEFLYFEQRMQIPNPNVYTAVWKESGGGTRKKSKNLWVYEEKTGVKRYSITTEAGAKIQPYFEVPPPTDPNLYYFKTQGEQTEDGHILLWVTQTTANYLGHLLGSVTEESLSNAILKYAARISEAKNTSSAEPEIAFCYKITVEAYERLKFAFDTSVSDEHRIQQLIRAIEKAKR